MSTGKFILRNAPAIRAALERATARREVLILETPYLRFESAFVRMEEEAIQASATMAYEDAFYALKSAELRMRFPHAFSFMEAPTQFLGFGVVGGRRTLRLRIPEQVEEDEQRRAYRVERVGAVNVTFSTRRFELISATLVNLSTMGARITALRDFHLDEVRLGDRIAITIPLRHDIHINHHAHVRYVNERVLGLEFHPNLVGALLDRLSRWVFQKREEDRERALNSAAGLLGAEPGLVPVKHQGLVLVSSEARLEEVLREPFAELPPMTRIPPNGQAVKAVDVQSEIVLLFHVPGLGMEERRRVRMLTELLGGRLPFVLLAPEDVDPAALSELASQLKAAASFRVGERPNPLLPRLILGIFRRHFSGEGAPAPR